MGSLVTKEQDPPIITTLFGLNKKILLKYPNNILLDHICPDLWNEIIKYLDTPLFILSNEESCQGYYKIKKDEFGIYGDKFFNYYFTNGGAIEYDHRYPPSKKLFVSVNNHSLEMGKRVIICVDNVLCVGLYGDNNEIMRTDTNYNLDSYPMKAKCSCCLTMNVFVRVW
jgi:hypothetical protein